MTTLEIIAPTNQSYTATIYQRGSDTPIETLNLTENTNSKGIYTGTVTSNLTGYYKVIAYDGTTPIVVTDVLFDGSSKIYASDISLSTNILTANNIWEFATRSLTDKSDFTLITDYDAAKTASQFNANTDIVARVTLVDTTTELTEDVSVDLSPISNSLSSIESTVNDIYERIVFTTPEGPVVPIPAPTANNVTIAYSYCYDTHGQPVAGVPITIKLMEVVSPLPKGSYLSDEITFVSNVDGIAMTEIPRGTSFRFRVKSGKNGSWIEFKGVDAESYQLPFLISK